MEKTFTAIYQLDKAKPVREQTPKIAATLRKAGRTPQGITVTENQIIVKGTIDGTDDSNTDS